MAQLVTGGMIAPNARAVRDWDGGEIVSYGEMRVPEAGGWIQQTKSAGRENETLAVDEIVAEKLEDGQFDNSSITFGDLTVIKHEIVSGLAAYYHARVEYPDFPTTETQLIVEPQAPSTTLNAAETPDAEPTEVS